MPALNSAALTVETVIDAPPERVRAVLLDFEKLPQWRRKQRLSNGFSVHRASDSTEVPGIKAQPGDIVKIDSVQVGQVEAEIYVRLATRPFAMSNNKLLRLLCRSTRHLCLATREANMECFPVTSLTSHHSRRTPTRHYSSTVSRGTVAWHSCSGHTHQFDLGLRTSSGSSTKT